MIIAVTGASGSIGSELVPFLISLGHNVIKVSSSELRDGKTVFTYQDLASDRVNIKIDLFIHLASHNSNLEEEMIDDEVQLTNIVLNAMKSLQCKKLIFFSTAKVYGDNSQETHIFQERSKLNPGCYYSEAKKLCEDRIVSASENEISSIIFRLPPLINKSTSSNLGKLLNIARKGIPIVSLSYGDDNNRSFITFNNIKTVFEILLNQERFENKNKIYNLSDNGFISLHNLLNSFGQGNIYIMPKIFSQSLFKIPFLKSFLIKLYGNFMLDNSKLQRDMNVKLTSTIKSVSLIFK